MFEGRSLYAKALCSAISAICAFVAFSCTNSLSGDRILAPPFCFARRPRTNSADSTHVEGEESREGDVGGAHMEGEESGSNLL